MFNKIQPGRFELKTTVVTPTAGQLNQLVGASNRRSGLILAHSGTADLWIMPSASLQSGDGISLKDVNSPLEISYLYWGDFLFEAWYGWPDFGGSNVTVMEFLQVPNAGF